MSQVKKRNRTNDVQELKCKKQQPGSKVQHITSSHGPFTVYQDPAAVSKRTTPGCFTDKENISDTIPIEPKGAKHKHKAHVEVRKEGRTKVKDEIHPEVKDEHCSEVKETQTELSTSPALGECACSCHQKSVIGNDEQKKEKTAEEEAWELMGQGTDVIECLVFAFGVHSC